MWVRFSLTLSLPCFSNSSFHTAQLHSFQLPTTISCLHPHPGDNIHPAGCFLRRVTLADLVHSDIDTECKPLGSPQPVSALGQLHGARDRQLCCSRPRTHLSRIFLWSLWVGLIGGRVHCTTPSHILFRWVLVTHLLALQSLLCHPIPPTHSSPGKKTQAIHCNIPYLSDTTEALIVNLLSFSPSKMRSKEVSPALLPGLGNVLPFNRLPHWSGSTQENTKQMGALPKLTQSPNHSLKPIK